MARVNSKVIGLNMMVFAMISINIPKMTLNTAPPVPENESIIKNTPSFCF